MTTFSSFSFRIIKISPYIIFLKSLAGFWRPPPGGARGQMPPPALPCYATASNVCSCIAFWKKNTIKRITFPKVLKCPLQFIKITLHLVVSIVLQKHYFHVFSKKKTVNFTRSCAFAQKV